MPIPLLAGAAIGAGSQLAGGILNSGAQRDANRESQFYSEKMYERQKADNLEFWRMQNEYNSPAAQMQRFKDAGLNPHLIYGQGSNGNSGAIQSPTVQRPEFNSTRPGDAISGAGLAFINGMYDLEMKQAQIDNLRETNKVIKEDAVYRHVQTILATTRNDRETFDLGQAGQIAPYNLEFLRERNRQIRTSTDLAINEDVRRASQNAANLKEIAERVLSMQSQRGVNRAQIAQMRATINNLEKEGILKQLDIDLKSNGIQPHDPMYARIVARLLTGTSDLLKPLESLPSEMKMFPGPKY